VRRELTQIVRLLTASLLIYGCNDESSISLSPAATQSHPIIEGQKCLPGEWESALEIVVEAEVDFDVFGKSVVTSSVCGATLIAPDVLLTAAHCFDTAKLTLGIGQILKLVYRVTWDDDLTYLDEAKTPVIPKNAVKVSAWFPHPKFDSKKDLNGLGARHDIAVLFLEKSLPFKPVTLVTREEVKQIGKGAEVMIAGWGDRSPGAIQTMMSFLPKQSSEKYCARTLINELGQNEMQIGSDSKSPRKCFGDSGGPTYMNILTPYGLEPRLIGVTSRAYDDEICLKGGIDTRVDPYLEWIDQTMRQGCKTGTRVWCDVEGTIPPAFRWLIGIFKTFLGWPLMAWPFMPWLP